MGIVIRQTAKHSIIKLVGVVLGAINVLFTYPLALTKEELGLFQFLILTATLITSFTMLGVNTWIVRFFPTFHNPKNGNNGFLLLISLGCLLGYFLFLILTSVFSGDIQAIYSDKSQQLQDSLYFIIPLVALIAYHDVLGAYISNFKRIVIPAIIREALKIVIPILAILFYWDYLNFSQFLWGIVGYYMVANILLIIYTIYLKAFDFRPNFSFLKPSMLKEMFVYAGYGILGMIGSQITNRIDSIMITTMMDEGYTGIYTIAFFMSNVILIPMDGLVKILSPLVAKESAAQNYAIIKTYYQQSSANLLLIGGLIFLLMWVSVDDYFDIMPNGEDYETGKYVILILGISKLFDLATSINQQIIGYSSYYRFNFYAILIFAAIVVISNYYLIPIFDINGAAMATLVSIGLFNISKTLFIYFKFKMQPFTIKTLQILFIGSLAYGVVFLIPNLGSPVLNVLLKSATVIIIYASLAYILEVSEQGNKLFHTWLNKITNN